MVPCLYLICSRTPGEYSSLMLSNPDNILSDNSFIKIIYSQQKTQAIFLPAVGPGLRE